MTKRTLLISIPLIAIALNGVGYLIVSIVRAPTTVLKPNVASEDRKRAEPEVAPVDDRQLEEYRTKEDRALARRAAGLAALEAGDYQKAASNFREAKSLLGERARVDELLRVTEELHNHPPRPAPREAAAEVAAVSANRTTVSRPRAGSDGLKGPGRSGIRPSARRVAIREEIPPDSNEPAVPPASGLLIVTTTPRGLLVQVDDAAIDLTPMRTRVRPGMRRIALLDGDRKVYETTLEVKEGATATLLKDLSAERPTEAPRAPVAPPGSEEPNRSVAATSAGAAAPPPPEPSSPTRARTSPGATAAQPGTNSDSNPVSTRGTGTLAVSSPGLYGIVWVNGRPRGYPPLEIADLPAGPAKIEVRVNGIQKRVSTVQVKPGLTTSVKMQSQALAPP